MLSDCRPASHFIRSLLPAIGDEVPNKELVGEIRKAAKLLLTALWEEGGYRFTYNAGRPGQRKVTFYYYCCQDDNVYGPKSEQDQDAERQKDISNGKQMTRYECHSRLTLLIDLEQQTVGLKLRHRHHKAYENTELTPAVKDFVMQRIFSATADDIYKELVEVEDTVAGAKHVRRRQVYYLWCKGNKAANASESVPDKGEASSNESVLDNGEADDGEANANESVLDNDNGESDREGSVANVSDGESGSQDEGDDDSDDEDNGDMTVKDSFESKSFEERLKLSIEYMKAIGATGNVQLIAHVEEYMKEAFAFASAVYDYKRKGRMDITRARNAHRGLEYVQE